MTKKYPVNKNQELYHKAMNAIDELWADRSVSKEDTKINLQAIIEEIEMKIESLGL